MLAYVTNTENPAYSKHSHINSPAEYTCTNTAVSTLYSREICVSLSPRCLLQQKPLDLGPGRGVGDYIHDIQITYISLSKPTQWAFAGPDGQVASSIFYDLGTQKGETGKESCSRPVP